MAKLSTKAAAPADPAPEEAVPLAQLVEDSTPTPTARKRPKDSDRRKSRSLDATDLLRVMYYADPGKGKTVDMAHMAKLGHIIYIDAEKRLKAGPLRAMGILLDNIERITECSYPALLELADEVRVRVRDGEDIVGLAWDSATETGRTLLEGLTTQGVQDAANRGKERVEWKVFQEDYGDMTEQMRRLIRKFRDIPIHLAVSCLAKRDQDENQKVRIAPALTPAVLRDFLGYMDVVVHKRVALIGEEDEYSGLTRPVGQFEAKDSFGVLPRVLINPSFDRILAYVRGDLTSAIDPIQQAAKARRETAKSADAEPDSAD